MFTTTLLPDFRKLTNYFENLNEEDIVAVESNGGVIVNLDYLNKHSFEQLKADLVPVLKQYQLEEHYQEILYLLLRKNEEIAERHNLYWHKYHEDKKLKELAVLLIGLKALKPKEELQVAFKPSMGGTLLIKDSGVAKWMVQTLLDKIEKQDYPLGLFGSQFHQLFDNFDLNNGISLDALKAASELKLQNPRLKLRPLYVELCLYLQAYLINQTHLTLPPNAKLTDRQANLFFDILQMLGYIFIDDFDSEPKDYIYSLFQNNKQSSVYQGNKID